MVVSTTTTASSRRQKNMAQTKFVCDAALVYCVPNIPSKTFLQLRFWKIINEQNWVTLFLITKVYTFVERPEVLTSLMQGRFFRGKLYSSTYKRTDFDRLLKKARIMAWAIRSAVTAFFPSELKLKEFKNKSYHAEWKICTNFVR